MSRRAATLPELVAPSIPSNHRNLRPSPRDPSSALTKRAGLWTLEPPRRLPVRPRGRGAGV